MNIVSNPQITGYAAGMYSIGQQECKSGWTADSVTGVKSLSVFGTAGNRYSLLIIEKEHLNTDYAGKNGEWYLKETKGNPGLVRFELQWAVEAPGSGCIVLCGREGHAPFCSSA